RPHAASRRSVQRRHLSSPRTRQPLPSAVESGCYEEMIHMSIREDSADLKSARELTSSVSVRERMQQLQDPGQPPAQPLEEDQSVSQPEENSAPYGMLTVRVPRFRIFYDAP